MRIKDDLESSAREPSVEALGGAEQVAAPADAALGKARSISSEDGRPVFRCSDWFGWIRRHEVRDGRSKIGVDTSQAA